jgi:hypothetical protein
MPDYKVYCIDGAGKAAQSGWIDAKNDDEALAFVRARRLSGRCEVWDGNRLVADVAPRSRE